MLAQRPDLLRCWAADCVGLVHRDYVWHEAARAWQTPDVGEQAVAAMFGAAREGRVAAFVALGIREDIAAEIAAAQNEQMGSCVVALYRSAAQPAMRELGERLQSTPRRPGLVIVATEDPHPRDGSRNGRQPWSEYGHTHRSWPLVDVRRRRGGRGCPGVTLGGRLSVRTRRVCTNAERYARQLSDGWMQRHSLRVVA